MANQKITSSKYLGDDYHKQADRERARKEFIDSAESIVIWGFVAVVVTAVAMVARSL